MNEFYYLSHGGPGSGRYPLGSGDRPYQKFEGSGSGRGGIRGYIQSKKAKKEERVQSKRQAEEDKRIEEERTAKQKHDADKERVLREGSPQEVLKYKGELTNKEWNDAAERLRLERQIESYASQDVKTALDKMKKLQSYTNIGSALAKDGIELWNSFAGIYNATPDGRKKPLTMVRR